MFLNADVISDSVICVQYYLRELVSLVTRLLVSSTLLSIRECESAYVSDI